MQSMSLHAVMSDSSVHLQLCLDIQDEDFALPKCEAVKFFQQVLKCRCISDSSFE